MSIKSTNPENNCLYNPEKYEIDPELLQKEINKTKPLMGKIITSLQLGSNIFVCSKEFSEKIKYILDENNKTYIVDEHNLDLSYEILKNKYKFISKKTSVLFCGTKLDIILFYIWSKHNIQCYLVESILNNITSFKYVRIKEIERLRLDTIYQKIEYYKQMYNIIIDEDDKYYALWMIARLTQNTSTDEETIKSTYLKTVELYPHRLEALYEYMDKVWLKKDLLPICGKYVETNIPKGNRVDISIYQWKFKNTLALSCYYHNDVKYAYNLFNQIKPFVPIHYKEQLEKNIEFCLKKIN